MDGLAAETAGVGVNKPRPRDFPSLEDIACSFTRKWMRPVGGKASSIRRGMCRPFASPPRFQRWTSAQGEACFKLLEMEINRSFDHPKRSLGVNSLLP